MSDNYNMIKDYYDGGLWSINRVWNCVGKTTGITAEEYYDITGFVYPAKS